MADDKIVDLNKAREEIDNYLSAGKHEAVLTGYGPIEKLVDWYVANGYTVHETLHAFAYSAAAQCFRDQPKEDAVEAVTDMFALIVSELLRYGPYYGDEKHGGASTDAAWDAVFDALQTAVDRHREWSATIKRTRAAKLD